MSYNGFYQAEWGWFSKDRFQISSAGIDYNNKHVALEEITGISWGATTTWYGGIIPQTDYKINIQSAQGGFYVYPTKRKIFDAIIDNLWQAVGVNLMVMILLKLREGKTLHIGQMKFTDLGIFLKNQSFFENDKKFFAWNEGLQIYSENGSVFIATKNKDYATSAPYDLTNTPVFEVLIRQFFKNFNYNNPRLSSLLQ